MGIHEKIWLPSFTQYNLWISQPCNIKRLTLYKHSYTCGTTSKTLKNFEDKREKCQIWQASQVLSQFILQKCMMLSSVSSLKIWWTLATQTQTQGSQCHSLKLLPWPYHEEKLMFIWINCKEHFWKLRGSLFAWLRFPQVSWNAGSQPLQCF